MPRVLKIFRSKASGAKTSSSTKEAKQDAKKVNRGPSKKGGIFRRDSSKNGNIVSSALEIKRSLAPAPIEQTLTWTLSDEADSPAHADQEQVRLLQEDPEADNKPLEMLEEKPAFTIPQQAFDTFVFTEEDLKQNELNHIQALSKLEAEIDELKKTNETLSKSHEVELARKEDEYVELLIQFRQKEHELEGARAELWETKDELEIVSSKLIQTQHEQYEENNKNQWMSVFGCSFATF